MRLVCVLAVSGVVGLAGCHSAFIQMTVSNHTERPIALVEVDYPSASFGTQGLRAGADFHYRFKVLGSGGTTVTWTDEARQEHKSSGPTLKEGDEGRMSIVFTPTGAEWSEALSGR